MPVVRAVVAILPDRAAEFAHGQHHDIRHFVAEIRFLAERSAGPAAKLLLPVVWLLPDFSLLNSRARLHLPGLAEPLLWGALYAFLYSAVCLGLTTALFRKREF